MLRVRPYKKQDAKNLVEWVTEERQCAMWGKSRFTYPLTLEQLEQYYQECETDQDGWLLFTALDATGQPVGHFRLGKADYEKETIHIGFIVVNPLIRGKGYGQEMVTLAVKYAKEILKVNRVTLNVFDVNPGARRCYEKVGFVEYGFEKDAFHYYNESWGIYRMEWLQL